MPNQLYPSKPRDTHHGVTLVRVPADSVRAAHDGLWQAFFQGYMGSPTSLAVPFLRDLYPWFGHTSHLKDLLHKTPEQVDKTVTAAFVKSMQVALASVESVPWLVSWEASAYNNGRRLLTTYPEFEIDEVHKLVVFLDIFSYVHRRLGKQSWNSDALTVLQNPHYRDILHQFGTYARMMP